MTPEMRRLVDAMIADTVNALKEGAGLHKTLQAYVYKLVSDLEPYYLKKFTGKG